MPLDRFPQVVRATSPAWFALIMATGIMAAEAHLLGFTRVATALLHLSVVAYVVAWLLIARRATSFPRQSWRELTDHRSGTGFFTLVAATGVLGSAFAALAGDYAVARALWLVALLLWLALTYAVFAALIVRDAKPPLDEGISGTWLLAVVATQSVAVLSADLATRSPYSRALEFLSLSMWLWGAMLYVWTISLLFYRCTFLRFEASDFSPPYWITMGAMAISTLAGSRLLANGSHAPWLASMAPFIKGFTVLCWATGTWWIPMLLVLSVWRHVRVRQPLRDGALVWSAVFPLGMYAVGTHEMAHAMDLDFMYSFLPLLGHVALAAWTVAAVGSASTLLRAIAAQSRPQN